MNTDIPTPTITLSHPHAYRIALTFAATATTLFRDGDADQAYVGRAVERVIAQRIEAELEALPVSSIHFNGQRDAEQGTLIVLIVSAPRTEALSGATIRRWSARVVQRVRHEVFGGAVSEAMLQIEHIALQQLCDEVLA